MCTVQSAQCLNCFYTTQFLINNHCMKQWFIKSSLIFLSYNQNISFVMKYLFRLWLIHTIQLTFCPFNISFIIRVFDRTRKCSQNFHIVITIWFQIVLNLMIISNSGKSWRCYNHHLSFTFDFLLRHITECFNNDCWFLLNVIRMQFFVFLDCLQCLWLRNIRIILCVLRNLIARSVRCIVLKNIQNKSFFNRLTHRIYMEWMIWTVIPFCTEHL